MPGICAIGKHLFIGQDIPQHNEIAYIESVEF